MIINEETSETKGERSLKKNNRLGNNQQNVTT